MTETGTDPGGGASLGAALLELPAELLRPYEFCLVFLRAVSTCANGTLIVGTRRRECTTHMVLCDNCRTELLRPCESCLVFLWAVSI